MGLNQMEMQSEILGEVPQRGDSTFRTLVREEGQKWWVVPKEALSQMRPYPFHLIYWVLYMDLRGGE